jgi:putative FmdB family regulatory protein
MPCFIAEARVAGSTNATDFYLWRTLSVPIFEYKCSKCGRISEFLEKAGGTAKRRCPRCGGELDKQLSVFAAQVKEGQSKKCLSCTDTACPYVKG